MLESATSETVEPIRKIQALEEPVADRSKCDLPAIGGHHEEVPERASGIARNGKRVVDQYRQRPSLVRVDAHPVAAPRVRLTDERHASVGRDGYLSIQGHIREVSEIARPPGTSVSRSATFVRVLPTRAYTPFCPISPSARNATVPPSIDGTPNAAKAPVPAGRGVLVSAIFSTT